MTISLFANFRRITDADTYGKPTMRAYREHKRMEAEDREAAYAIAVQKGLVFTTGSTCSRPGRKLREGQL